MKNCTAWRATAFPQAFRFRFPADPKTADNDKPGQPGFFIADPMDKKKKWRDQEQALMERWTAATERFRLAHAGNVAAEVQAAQAELELLRRQVARLKSEFNTGKRY